MNDWLSFSRIPSFILWASRALVSACPRLALAILTSCSRLLSPPTLALAYL